MEKKRILVIGGVAAGASFAARARRLDEGARITVVERGPEVSFANCGLPYFIGGEIGDRGQLAVQTPESLRGLLELEVLTKTEAVAIDRVSKRVRVRRVETGEEAELDYDYLMLAPGAVPLRPPLAGIEDEAILSLRNLQDMDAIKIRALGARRAVVIGAGFIGLEMAEQLKRLGLEVTVVELQEQVLPQLDREMARLMETELERNGIELILGDGIAGFSRGAEGLCCRLNSGKELATDLVILSIGVRPETQLAKAAGLELGPRGHVLVDEWMRTSDPSVYAAGDAVQTRDFLDGSAIAVPLGGPANRQGRVAADHIFLGERARPYPGSLGTAIVRVFEVAAGVTGWTERRLRQAGRAYRVSMVNDNHHAGYYPGAKPLTLKIVWDPGTLRVLGAQVTGFAGVDKRLDVMATALTAGLTVEDLCHLELAYAPPFGSAKDIINLAGFCSVNQLDGLVEPVHELPEDPQVQVLDVRPEPLSRSFPLQRPGVVNIPFATLRKRMGEIDRSRPVVTICAFGKMSYFAARILQQNGYSVRSFSGGIKGSIDPRTPAKMG